MKKPAKTRNVLLSLMQNPPRIRPAKGADPSDENTHWSVGIFIPERGYKSGRHLPLPDALSELRRVTNLHIVQLHALTAEALGDKPV
jgi:hypothetical protein